MALLQASGSAGVELLLSFAVAGLFLLIAVGVSVYVYRDAKRRNSNHALAWALGALIGGFWVWILYFVVRDDIGPYDSSASGG